MMPAAKMLDPIVGLDVHMIQPPGPVPPIPVPHPHTGILFDPFDLAPYIGATVTIGGIPRAVAGSGTKMIPDHIPIGGVFVKPPANDSELFMGSSTVLADGEPFGYLALPLLSCWDVGMPPIPRPPRSLLPSMVLPTTVCMAVPSGVTVGGSPTVSMSALADRIGLGPLMAAYEFAKTGNPMALLGLLGPAMKGAKKLNKKFKFIKKSKCGRGVKLFGGKVSIGGDPVNLVTGEVLDDVVDALEPGGLFRWERFYGSSKCNRAGPMGHGFTHAYEHALELHPQAWRYRDADDTEIDFEPPTLARPESVNGGMRLRLVGASMAELRHRDDPVLRFILPESRRSGAARLVEVSDGRRTLQLRHRGERLEGFVERGPDGREVRFVLDYDDLGRVIGLWRHGDGPRTCLARYAYDRRRGLLEKAQDAGNRLTQYAYDAQRRLVSRTDPGGYAFAWRYDAKGRCVETRGRDGLWASVFEYHPELFETHELREGARFIVRYDANGRITEQIAPDGTKVVREIDAEGRVVLETDAAGRTMRWRYDQHGAHQDRVDGLGNVFPPEWEAPHLEDPMAPRWPETQYAREVGGFRDRDGPGAGWLIRRLHPSGQASALHLLAKHGTVGLVPAEHDFLGRTVSEAGLPGLAQVFAYGHAEQPLRRVDCDGRIWSYTRSRWNLVTSEVDPLGNTTQYQYNAREHVTAIVDGRGNVTRYVYDEQDRLVEIERPSGVEESWSYVGDRVVEVCGREGNWIVRRDYDARGLETRRELRQGGVHLLRYDSGGRPIMVSTEQHRVVLAWSRRGVVSTDKVDGVGLSRLGPHTTILEKFVITSRASADGRVSEIVGPTGEVHRVTRSGRYVLREHVDAVQELSAFDPEGRVLGRTRCSLGYDGTANVHSVVYGYSPQGDLVSSKDSGIGTTWFRVDDAHRLVGVDGPNSAISYAYDEADNLVGKEGFEHACVGPNNDLIAAGDLVFEYDDHFNLASRREAGRTTKYVYDSLGQLIRVETEGEEPWQAEYDAWGRRLACGRATAQRRFYWDGERLAAEVFPSGGLRIYLYVSDDASQPIAFVDYESVESEPRDGAVYFVFSDQVGLPRRIEDEYGRCVWRVVHADPYGSLEVAPESTLEYGLRWAGHYFDRETGLHQNRYRDYDPRLGRYLQTDPSGQSGGTNLYAYPSNPLVEVDPLGLSKKCGGASKGKGGSARPSKGPGTKGKTKAAAGAVDGGPPPRRPGEPLGKRHGLTADQRKHFRERQAAANGDPGKLEDVRYDRTQTRRKNKGQEPYDNKQEWKDKSKGASANRERGNKVESDVRPGVSDHVGQPLESGNSFPDPERPGKTTKYEPTVTMPDGSKVKTRPDGITKGPDGHPDPSGVVQDNKHFMGSGNQKYPETQQLAAQRQLAESNGGKHVVSLSSDAADLQASPPRPHPDAALGGSSSEVVYADPSTGAVTHVWDGSTQSWTPKE